MKTKLWFGLLSCFVAAAPLALSQGTYVYDQQSSTDEDFNLGGGAIQFASVGQSLAPVLGTVDFVRLKLYDIAPGNSLGANVVVNLRANAINGTILGTTPAVSMADGFRGSVNFIFANSISVTPDTTYYFDVFVQSGDNWGFMAMGDVYPRGSFYSGGFPTTGNDFWFREGVIVPEPSVVALLSGGGVFIWLIRKKQRGR